VLLTVSPYLPLGACKFLYSARYLHYQNRAPAVHNEVYWFVASLFQFRTDACCNW